MKKLIFFSFLLVFQSGFSQKIEDKALLWEISGNGLTQPSYIYGTIHIACKGMVIITPQIQKALDQTQMLFLEVNIGDPSLTTKMMQLAVATDGKTMSGRLGDEIAQKLDKMLEAKLGVGLAVLDNLKPQMLLAQMSLLGLDCPLDVGYDMMLLMNTMKEGKSIGELETFEDQIEVLFSMSDDDAIQSIKYMVENTGELQEQTNKMLRLYSEQDLQGMYNMTLESYNDPDYPQADIKELLDNRNVRWIPVIEKQIVETPTFIACGAAHLAGDNGIINLLRKQGFIVNPVK